MAAGRPRKPNALKKAKGTFRPDKGDYDQMKPDLWEHDAIPTDLNEPGKIEWERVVPQLKQLGVLTKIDYSMLWNYCHEFGKYIEYEKLLAVEGRVIKAKNGFLMLSPYETLSDKAWKKAKELATQFGLTPSARTRISTSYTPEESPEIKAKNKLEELRSKAGGRIIPISGVK